MPLQRTYLQAQVVEHLIEYTLNDHYHDSDKEVYSSAYTNGRERGYCFYTWSGEPGHSLSAFVANHRNTDEYIVILTADKNDWAMVTDEEWKAKLFFPSASPGDVANCVLHHLGFHDQAFY